MSDSPTINGKGQTSGISYRQFISVMNGIGSKIENALLSRTAFASPYGQDARRNLDIECGYPEIVTKLDYKAMYDREGIASRVVEFLSQEAWKEDPIVYETEDPEETEWEKAVNELVEKQCLWHFLQRADELSGIGHFGVMLYGLDDGLDLSKPVSNINEKGESVGDPPERKLLYLRVFDESFVDIVDWEKDPSNPRYGHPTMYEIETLDPTTQFITQPAKKTIPMKVHWTRVQHFADNRKSSEIIGTPRMKPVYNYILNLKKIGGGSAEMFWQGAQPGIAFEVNPDIADAQMDTESIRKEFERYMNKLQRYIAINGVSAKSLAPQAVDPEGHVMVQLKLITITLGAPLRVFMGSEQAHLASTQDIKNWNGRLSRRNNTYTGPWMVRPTLDRLMLLGVLPQTREEKYFVDWPDLDAPSDLDRATVAEKIMKCIQTYVQSGAQTTLPPKYFWVDILGFTDEEADAIIEEAEELFAEAEAEKQQKIDDGIDPNTGLPLETKDDEEKEPSNGRPTNF